MKEFHLFKKCSIKRIDGGSFSDTTLIDTNKSH